jgi:hypothetical protein
LLALRAGGGIAMHNRRHRLRSQARPALLWTLLVFLGGNLALGLHLSRRHPEFFDPEMSMRLNRLPKRLAEAPGRPLALALGSSRIVMGFRPASVMEQAPPSDPQPVLFNFGMLGIGPVGERLVLHRLIQKGIRPKWLFLEVYAPFLTQSSPFIEEPRTFSHDFYWSDVPIIARLYHRRWEAVGQVIEQTMTPLFFYREAILSHYAPAVAPPTLVQLFSHSMDLCLTHRLDDFGWVDYDIQMGDVHQDAARRVTKPMFDHFAISPLSDRALHDLLAECRAHDIQVLFLLMPEHSLVRGWYPSMQHKLLPYLRQLSAENHAPIIDTRTWQPDKDIPDCCHLSPQGAHSFSERFGREVYRPLVQGRPLPKEVLLDEGGHE